MASTQSPVAKVITSCSAQTCFIVEGLVSGWDGVEGRGVGWGVYETAYREAGSKDKNFSCHLQTWVRICSVGRKECFHVCRNQLHLQTDRSLFWMQMTALRLQQRWHRILTGSDLLTRGRKRKKGPPTFSPIILFARVDCALYTP